ncbi:MAG: hypothetical protein EPO24_02615 [Bacteroidetes bacterium]|nr:MAG: hypothetical protein EPO24_02615 [Bacteroidota bacterium]
MIIFSGCAGISFLELQDAETLGEGNSSIALGSSLGLDIKSIFIDSLSSREGESYSWVPIEAHFQTGVRENMDVGVSLWNSSLLSVFRFKQRASYYDVGMALNAKYRMTPQAARRNVAFSVSLMGQLAGYSQGDDYWNYRTAAIAPGIFYSNRVKMAPQPVDSSKKGLLSDVIITLYAGLKTYFIVSDIKRYSVALPTEMKDTKFFILYDPFVGITAGEDKIYYLEAHVIIMKHPYNGATGVYPSIGMGGKIIF